MTDIYRAPRNLDFVQGLLIKQTALIGDLFGVKLTVGRRDDMLVFCDPQGREIIDPGGKDNPMSPVICATFEECDNGMFLKLYTGRALYAVLTLRANMAEMNMVLPATP